MAFRVILDTEEQIAKYERLSGLSMRSSKYPHPQTMEQLGIAEDVLTLFRNIGWDSCIQKRWPTYPSLVVEFLASLQVHESGIPKEPTSITFQLCNVEHSLSQDKLDEILGCPTGGLFHHHQDFSLPEFWQAISAEAPKRSRKFESGNCKVSSISNPVFRYIQRAMALSIFGRQESGKARHYDLYVLWSMLGKNNISLAAFLIDNWKRQSIAKSGLIWCGGFITPIAEHFGVELDALEQAVGGRDVDKSQLMTMHMIICEESAVFLKLSNGDVFPLPNSKLTHVTDLHYRDNWLMRTTAHLRLCKAPNICTSKLQLTSSLGQHPDQRQEQGEQQTDTDMEDIETEQPDNHHDQQGSPHEQDQSPCRQLCAGAHYEPDQSTIDHWSRFHAFMDEQRAHNQLMHEMMIEQQSQLKQLITQFQEFRSKFTTGTPAFAMGVDDDDNDQSRLPITG